MADNPQARDSEKAASAVITVPEPNTKEYHSTNPSWNRISKVFWAWWMLVVHLLMCIAIALVMALLLDGYKAFDNATERIWGFGTKRYRLRINEVATILSAALAVVQFCVAQWAATVQKSKPRDSSSSSMPVFICLILQPFAVPLVNGAVGWSISSQRVETEVMNVNYSGDSLDLDLTRSFFNTMNGTASSYPPEVIGRLDWTQLVRDPEFMKALPVKGAGLVSRMWGTAEGSSVSAKTGLRHPALCRQQVAYASGPIPVNSTAYGNDLPCIMIENIHWQRPSEETVNMTESTFATSRFSIFKSNLLDYQTPGSAILFDSQQPTLHETYDNGEPLLDYPAPEIFTRSNMSLLILLDRAPSSCSMEALENNTMYGSIATILPPESIWSSGDFCYAYATVGLTAGVVQFKEAEFASPYTLQSSDSDSRSLSQADFKPETWVKPAMVLLPDVMALVSIANTSEIPTWNNLPGYVETLIQQSYLASWGVLRPFNDSRLRLLVSKVEPRLIATVCMGRLWVWFIISMFVPLSGLLWYYGEGQETSE